MAAMFRYAATNRMPHIISRCVTTKSNRAKMNRDKKKGPTIDSTATSLAAKGFLRSQAEYNPPADIAAKIDQLFAQTAGTNGNQVLETSAKFQLLSACYRETGHSVPNSLLHTIQSLGDVKKFYGRPVNTTLPLDIMRKGELPKNLHIQYEYHRFHPETDTMFGGISAFPESSTLVTGLKTRKMYKGYTAKKAWPT